jgi:transposase
MTKRTRYSQEFKREAVAMASEPGVTCRQVALEIGVNPNLLSRWKRELEEVPAKAFKGSGTPRDEELARLKRELARIKKERDFLREAATFFAKGSS